VSVVAHHQVLNITISNYDDELHVTFIALREAIPDVQRLADGTARALVELQHSLARRGRTAGATSAATGEVAKAPPRRSSRPAAKTRKTAAPARPLH
jgi:hypothetical protein